MTPAHNPAIIAYLIKLSEFSDSEIFALNNATFWGNKLHPDNLAYDNCRRWGIIDS